MTRSFFFIIVFFVFQYTSFAQVPPIIVKEEQELLPIGKSMLYLEDKTGKLSLEQLLQPDYQTKFQYNKKNIFHKPASRASYWFKIVVANHTKEKIWLDIASITPWYLDLYAMDSVGKYQKVVETGSLRPYTTRAYSINTFWLPLNPAGKSEAITYYFRISSERVLALPMCVGTTYALQQQEMTGRTIVSIFMGIVLVTLLYNLFLFITVKDWIYFVYIGHLATASLSVLYLTNYPPSIFIPFVPTHFWHTYQYTWFAVTTLFTGLFIIYFLALHKKRSLLFYILLICMFFNCMLLPVLNIFFFSVVDLNKIELLTAPVIYLVCFLIGFTRYLKKVKNADFYIVAWSFGIVGLVVHVLVLQDILPYNLFTKYALILGNAVGIPLFSIALGNRINTLQKTNTVISIEKEYLDNLNMELALMNEELKTNTAYLAEVNTAKNKLFSILGHDLRAPIGSLEGMLELMNIGMVSYEEFQELMPQFHKNVKNLQSTLENLLQWSISQMEGMNAQPMEVSVKMIAEEQMLLFAEVSKEKYISLKAELLENIMIWADENHVRLLLRNLINNALKFTHEGGEIKILATAQLHLQTVVISVQDNGVGIPPEQANKLFKKNLSFTTYGTGGEKGTGLGLQLCQEIVGKNGGKIWVVSEQGKGSTFSFSLPTQRLS